MIRVLHDPPLDGPTNMARDEALMAHVGAAESPPTLRLYEWAPPTISLGYFQRYAEYESLASPAGTLPIVRRLTGGGAILHDQELTYSLTLPAAHSLVSNKPNRLYELAHDAIIACLASLGITASRGLQPARTGAQGHSPGTAPAEAGSARGPFFCFVRRHAYDVLIGPEKVAGSAQRRTRNALLQHGSIILGNRYRQQATADISLPFDESVRLVRSGLVEHLARLTGDVFEHGDWCTTELAAADELIAKYANDSWTRRT